MTNRSRTPPSLAARREFVKRTGAIAATGIAAPALLNLAAAGRLAAAGATDYKALVCVFLYGGNDHYNTFVPHDEPSHAAYAASRPGIATARDALGPTTLDGAPLPGGVRYALAPELTRLHAAWKARRLAAVLNVGPLLQPTTKAEYAAGRVPLPAQIFSHSNQQALWQSVAAGDAGGGGGGPQGWGGRTLEAFADANADETFAAVSVASDALLLSGASTARYRLAERGPVGLNARRWNVYGSPAVSSAVERLMTADHEHLLRAPLGSTAARAIDANERLGAALAGTDAAAEGMPGTLLGRRLGTVARMIDARERLGMRRQLFFVGLGGFDHHGGLGAGHPAKLAELDGALGAFDAALSRLGLADAVTTFTASDFGRTLSSNGDGSDHGWGAHHVVLGGAVDGGRFVGRAPELGDDGPDDVGRGRLLPTLAVDQLGATLGRWFGASGGEITDVFPHLGRFDAPDLGFMRTA